MAAENNLMGVQLAKLELSDKTRTALEQHLTRELAKRLIEGTLCEIPGIELEGASEISTAILAAALNMSVAELNDLKSSATVPDVGAATNDANAGADDGAAGAYELVDDPGMERVLEAVGTYAKKHYFVPGEDFYELTVVRHTMLEKAFKRLGKSQRDLLTAYYGLYDHTRHSMKECVELGLLGQNATVSKFTTERDTILHEFFRLLAPDYGKERFAGAAELPLSYLGLSRRVYRALNLAGFQTVQDLIGLTDSELKKQVANFGNCGLEELRGQMKLCGYCLRKERKRK